MQSSNKMIKVLSVNVSEQKGTIKKPVSSIELNNHGVVGDAHAGKWHRQVSLLATESITKFSVEANRHINFGEFAENITTEGALLYQLNIFDRLVNNHVELMVTQIGKKCHGDNCNIFKEVGNCVMPKEGIFAKVIKDGSLNEGDELMIVPKVFKCKIIVLSDRASSGEYIDKSGAALKELIHAFFVSKKYPVDVEVNVIPDEPVLLKKLVQSAIDDNIDVVFTSGGTGVGPRDITPETVNPMIEKEIPGIMESIRMKYGAMFPNALLSRSKAGLTNQTLIFTLPGNPKAVNEYFVEIEKVLFHLYLMIWGIGH